MTALADAVAALLVATEATLRESHLEPVSRTPDTVAELLRAGEDVVAYETLRDNLYEDDVDAPVHLLHAVRSAAREAGADVTRIAPLLW